MKFTIENRTVPARFRQRLLDMSRRRKRVVLAALDFAVLAAILWLTTSLRYNTPYQAETTAGWLVFWAGPPLTIASFAYLGLYRFVTRYLSTHGYTRIIVGFAVSVLMWSLLVFMSGQLGVPRSVILVYSICGAVAVIAIRVALARFLTASGVELPRFRDGEARYPVLIYGAGQSGLELAMALYHSRDRYVVGFCDSSPSLWGQYIGGHKVYRPERLGQVIERYGVREILLALPDSHRTERRLVLKELERFPVTVKVLPTLAEIASGSVALADLRPLDVEDLLGRDPVPPNHQLLGRDTRGKNVLVTGAGGSVGSELVRQVLRQSPRRIVLFDVSEPSLYEIEVEVRDEVATYDSDKERPEVVAVLGTVLNSKLVKETLLRHQIQTIYHAAAYKHVPMVECNATVGLTNNVLGTEIMADAAVQCGVERMVLISTDKAVRPTNVMGASKRLAELVLQARAAQQTRTVFTMVRFGNVLDSSGSVVQRFRRQIKARGPVTVTHPEVVRYFMSIPEAAELVIQAGAMARGGDLFVLDMGEPVRIKDLAELMIRLSGLEIRGEANPNGDVEIVYTGLRPGEKLYEELLIGANTSLTEHLRIMRSDDEPAMTPPQLRRELDVLKAAMDMGDLRTIQAVLMRTVEGYRPDSELRSTGSSPVAAWALATRTLH